MLFRSKVLQLGGQVGDMKALLAKGDGKGLIRRISALRKASIVLISALTIDISQLPGPRNWVMADGSNGYRAALVRRQRTPGLISSLPGTAGLPLFTCFSTSYLEFASVVRRPMRGWATPENYFTVAASCLGRVFGGRCTFVIRCPGGS